MTTKLRIMAWNIAEGRLTPDSPSNIKLPAIAQHICALSPDIVLLNEVKNERDWPFGSGVNQVEELARLTGMPYRHWANTVATGLTGHKAVGILSRYPLGVPRVHRVMCDGSETAFATLETTVTVNNRVHHLLSTRFAPHNTPEHAVENVAGITQAISLVRNIDPQRPVIFGGDFNAEPQTPQMVNFYANSGLLDAYKVLPDPELCSTYRVDYIFYRGPYKLNVMQQRCSWPSSDEPSDHPFVFIELESTEPTECASIRVQIAGLTDRINALREQWAGLDPKDPQDRETINIITTEIEELNEQIAVLRQRASALGCP